MTTTVAVEIDPVTKIAGLTFNVGGVLITYAYANGRVSSPARAAITNSLYDYTVSVRGIHRFVRSVLDAFYPLPIRFTLPLYLQQQPVAVLGQRHIARTASGGILMFDAALGTSMPLMTSFTYTISSDSMLVAARPAFDIAFEDMIRFLDCLKEFLWWMSPVDPRIVDWG